MALRLLFLLLIISSCDSNILPKQKGFFAPDFNFPNYKILESCNHSFKLNNASKIVAKPDCNYEIEYDELNAKIYVSNIIVENNFDMISKKFDEKVFNNSEFADQILTSEFSNPYKDVFSRVYFFVGDAPSNIQFFITDSTQNFLSASLLFDSKPNYDSLLPYIHYIRNDIKKIVESFDWSNK